VATFTVSGGSGSSNYSASINWGDGSQSGGSISETGDGTYTVTGSNNYSSAGTYTVSTTITDESGQASPATASCTGTVALVSSLTAANSDGDTADAGGTLEFTRDSGGSASVTALVVMDPDTDPAYAVAAYQLADLDGNLVGSGGLSQGGTGISIPQPTGGEEDKFVLTAGVMDNGNFVPSLYNIQLTAFPVTRLAVTSMTGKQTVIMRNDVTNIIVEALDNGSHVDWAVGWSDTVKLVSVTNAAAVNMVANFDLQDSGPYGSSGKEQMQLRRRAKTTPQN
jgi:hypothetical protein